MTAGDFIQAWCQATRTWVRVRIVRAPVEGSDDYVVVLATPDPRVPEPFKVKRHEMQKGTLEPAPAPPMPMPAPVPASVYFPSVNPVDPFADLLLAPPTPPAPTARGMLDAKNVAIAKARSAEGDARQFLTWLSGSAGLDDETPGRFVRAMSELVEGYAYDDAGLVALCRSFATEGDSGMVAIARMPFASLCEHHALPFAGEAAVAYVPGAKIVGLSKVPRLLRAVTRRFQVQERIGKQVGDVLWEAIEPLGVLVAVRARHTCCELRGVESSNAMVTSYMRGVFKEKHEARAEAFALFAAGGW